MKVNKPRQRLVSPHRNWYDDFETVDCDVCGNERDKKYRREQTGADYNVEEEREGGEGRKQTGVIIANRVIAL